MGRSIEIEVAVCSAIAAALLLVILVLTTEEAGLPVPKQSASSVRPQPAMRAPRIEQLAEIWLCLSGRARCRVAVEQYLGLSMMTVGDASQYAVAVVGKSIGVSYQEERGRVLVQDSNGDGLIDAVTVLKKRKTYRRGDPEFDNRLVERQKVFTEAIELAYNKIVEAKVT